MDTGSKLIETTLADPCWLAHRFDPGRDAVHYLCVTRDERRAIPFLNDDYFGARAPVVLTRRDSNARRRGGVPVNFIFHSAFCCSTLLAGALDIAGVATSFSEPMILQDMVGWRHRGGGLDPVRAGLDDALGWLTPFAKGESIVVKPSNLVNGLAATVLALRPASRAIFLHAPLRAYLASITRKGMDGRLWARDLLAKQLADGMIDLGFAADDYLRLTDLQAAAVGWLVQQHTFTLLAARDPSRLFGLDSEVLVARPVEALTASVRLFGLAVTATAIDAIVAKHFSRNSKDGAPFAQGQREAERTASEALHADELHKVALWAEAVAANAGVTLTTPNPLIR